jgi:hypothetical protein
MSRVYISSWSKPLALAAKTALEEVGHVVISTWHDREIMSTKDRPWNELESSANENIETIVTRADALLLLVPEDLTPGGIYVEAGAALGMGVPVLAVGQRKNVTRGNNMLYHPDVHQYGSIDNAVDSVTDIIANYEYEDDEDDLSASDCTDSSTIIVSPDLGEFDISNSIITDDVVAQ